MIVRNKLKQSHHKINGKEVKFEIKKKGLLYWCEATNRDTPVKIADKWTISMPNNEACASQEEAENYTSVLSLN